MDWETRPLQIICNNLKTSFVPDLASTLPGLLSNQLQKFYWFKLIRFYHIREVFGHMAMLLKEFFSKIGLNKSAMDKFSYVGNLLIIMITSIHVLACCWIYIGLKFDCTWLKAGCNEDNYQFANPDTSLINSEKEYQVFVTAVYWVITTLTTVGYGDFKGFSNEEYVFQMVVEFLGIGLFSFLMGSINNLVVSEQKLQDIIDDKIEDLDIWLRKLDKSRSKILPKPLYDNIKDFVEKSFYFDYNQIRSQEFFEQLKPKIRFKLVETLFSGFIENFDYMFNDHQFGFEGGREFICDFLSNLYSRIYLPGEDIVLKG